MYQFSESYKTITDVCDKFNRKWFELEFRQKHPKKDFPSKTPSEYNVRKKAGVNYLGPTLSEAEFADIAGKILAVLNAPKSKNINVNFYREDLTKWKSDLQGVIDSYQEQNKQVLSKQEEEQQSFDPNLTLLNIPLQVHMPLQNSQVESSVSKKQEKKRELEDSSDEDRPEQKIKKIEEVTEPNLQKVELKPEEVPTKPQKVVNFAYTKQPSSNQKLFFPCAQKTPFEKEYDSLKLKISTKSSYKGYWNEHDLERIKFVLICCAKSAVELWKYEIENDSFYKSIISPEEIGIALHARAEAFLSKLLEEERFNQWKGFILIEPVYFPPVKVNEKPSFQFIDSEPVDYPKSKKNIMFRQIKIGSVKPDVVILSANKGSNDDVEAIFDFKFTTDVYKDSFFIPNWDEYVKGPYQDRNQKEVYQELFKLNKGFVTRIHQSGSYD